MPTLNDDWIQALRRLTAGEQRLRVLAVLAAGTEPAYHEHIRAAFTENGWPFHPTGLSKVLRELEVDGYIIGDVPAKQRHGRAVRYSINKDVIGSVLGAAGEALGTD